MSKPRKTVPGKVYTNKYGLEAVDDGKGNSMSPNIWEIVQRHKLLKEVAAKYYKCPVCKGKLVACSNEVEARNKKVLGFMDVCCLKHRDMNYTIRQLEVEHLMLGNEIMNLSLDARTKKYVIKYRKSLLKKYGVGNKFCMGWVK